MPSAQATWSSPRSALVHRLATSLGFAMVGIAPALPSQRWDQFRAWLDAGKHGDMEYLEQKAETARDPGNLVPGARSIICVADRYAKGSATDETKRDQHDGQGRIARYAQGDDYHRVMKNRLHELADAMREKFPEHVFRSAVDTAPVMEREHAARAGMGWIGKHTLLIHPQHGSFFLLGEIITTLALESSGDAGFPPPMVPPADHCGSCTRCIDACPTQCITPYSVDASRCISYLTIEHRAEIAPDLHPAMGHWIAGCDVCQNVCPYNQHPDSDEGPAVHPAYASRLPSLPLLQVLNWSEEDRRAAVVRSPLKRIKLDMFRRNAVIAAGNHLKTNDDEALKARIRTIAADDAEPELVRETARQVLDSLA